MPLENSKLEVIETAKSIRFVFSSTFDNIDIVCDKSIRFLQRFFQHQKSSIDKQLFSINLVIREGLTNAVRHGNGSDPQKVVKCLMAIENENMIKLVIEDQGDGFDWQKQRLIPARDDEDHGRGFLIMETYFSRYSYNKKGNILYLEKKFPIADINPNNPLITKA